MARDLTPEQQAEADRIEERLLDLVRADLRELAESLASKSDRQLLGRAEFEVRDRVHRIGARAIEAALAGRERGATAGRA
jgi:nucleoid DNA-binding protein